MKPMTRLGLATFACVFAGVFAGVAGPVSADRGMIRNVRMINVEEPAQRAIIAFNGTREVLILQTDVRAAEETRVVEFMPLPSKPEVSLAPETCFAELAKIVREHRLAYGGRSGRTGQGVKDEGAGAAVVVVVTAQLGPHAVTVVEVKDADAFTAWVKDFFRKNDLGEPALEDQLRVVVSDYLNRNIRFFAFDVVTMSPEKKTVQPLAYRFDCDRLYYPLKVTNLYGGTGVVELFVVIPESLDRNRLGGSDFIRISQAPILRAGAPNVPAEVLTKEEAKKAAVARVSDRGVLRSNIVALKPEELRGLHPDIPAVMWNGGAHMIAVRYAGPLHFDADVEGVLGFGSSTDAARAFFRTLRTGNAEMLGPLVGVPFAFDGREVVTDKAELMKKFERAIAKPLGEPDAQPEVVEMPVGSYRFVLREDFDRRFVEQHLLKGNAAIVGLTLAGEEARIFVRRDADRLWRVVGFRD
ncbi:MAG TPA: DUF2330 domain-containing protein [Planctomycetota bacterium]|nr:DUF2330 domain-containing protein [Planctomycetota bacterium]